MSIEEQIIKLSELHESLQNTKISVEKEVKRLRATVQWVLGIGIPLMILLTGGIAELRARQTTAETKIQTINMNYTPFELVVNIEESNQKMINVLTAIKANDDPRYQEALKEYNTFNMEALRRIQSQLNLTRGGK